MQVKSDFVIGKNPFIRRADSNVINTKKIMLNFIVSLIPIIVFAWYINGIDPFINKQIQTFKMIYPLAFVLCGALSSYLIEAFYYLIILKEEECFKKAWDNYALIPGLLLSMILPLTCPIWVLVIGSFFAIVVVKMLFGGFSYNIFNPALLAYIFVMVAFYDSIVNNKMIDTEIISSATPLTSLKNIISNKISINDIINDNKVLFDMFLYSNEKSIAESSPILCLLSFFYLSFKNVIDYKIPIIYILTIFVMSLILGYFLNVDGLFKFSIFNILNGGIIFASIFMITEPVTSPRNYNAKIIYIILIAVITIFLRFIGDLPDGVSTAILFMNMLAPSLDTLIAPLSISDNVYKKIAYSVMMIFIIIVLLSYTVLKLLGE